jgi:GxxExxY protein
MATAAELNSLTDRIIGSGIRVHKEIGPGLLESAYRRCLVAELDRCGLQTKSEHPVPLTYHGLAIDCGYRVDILVEDAVVVEIKSIERLARVHTAQMLTYLRLTGCHVGLIMNFNAKTLPEGIKRVVLNFPE